MASSCECPVPHDMRAVVASPRDLTEIERKLCQAQFRKYYHAMNPKVVYGKTHEGLCWGFVFDGTWNTDIIPTPPEDMEPEEHAILKKASQVGIWRRDLESIHPGERIPQCREKNQPAFLLPLANPSGWLDLCFIDAQGNGMATEEDVRFADSDKLEPHVVAAAIFRHDDYEDLSVERFDRGLMVYVVRHTLYTHVNRGTPAGAPRRGMGELRAPRLVYPAYKRFQLGVFGALERLVLEERDDDDGGGCLGDSGDSETSGGEESDAENRPPVDGGDFGGEEGDYVVRAPESSGMDVDGGEDV